MSDLIQPLVDRVQDALDMVHSGATLRWGTVTTETPLRVRLDADTTPLPFSPATAVTGLRAGERVLCAEQRARVTVVNVAGRGAATQPVVNAGTNTVDYVTPSTLKSALASGEILPPRLLGGSLPSNDLNAAKTTGWYRGYEWVNAPGGVGISIAVVEIIVYSADWVLQRFTPIAATIKTYQRVFYNGTTWSTWQEL